MLKAEQSALVQEANQQLIAIRQAELDYFQNFYGIFGTQSALIAGFVVSALTGKIDIFMYVTLHSDI